MEKSFHFTIITVLIFINFVEAQQVVSITKADALSKISERNLALKISEKEFNQAKADFNQTNSIFLPNITASHTGISTTNPLMAFGSKLNQAILTQNDFNPNLLNNPKQTQNFATILEIQQPLINLDGLYQRKAARSRMDAILLKTERTADYLTLEVEKAYMQLQLAYKGVQVLDKALQAAKANKEIAENSFKQGYLQRADILNIEMRVADVRSQLQTAKSNVQNASNYLSFLMDDKTDVVFIPVDSLAITSSIVAVQQISENRADIKAMELASKAHEQINKANKMAFLPRLNLFGSYQMYDNKIFQGGADGYLIGAELSWDIFQGSKRFAKAQKSKSEFEQSKLEYHQYVSKSNLELNKVKRQLEDAKNRLEYTNLAVQQSEESLRIRKNRFKEGLEKTSDLLIAESKYAQKQLEYYQTIFEYNFTEKYLEFLTKN